MDNSQTHATDCIELTFFDTNLTKSKEINSALSSFFSTINSEVSSLGATYVEMTDEHNYCNLLVAINIQDVDPLTLVNIYKLLWTFLQTEFPNSAHNRFGALNLYNVDEKIVVQAEVNYISDYNDAWQNEDDTNIIDPVTQFSASYITQHGENQIATDDYELSLCTHNLGKRVHVGKTTHFLL